MTPFFRKPIQKSKKGQKHPQNWTPKHKKKEADLFDPRKSRKSVPNLEKTDSENAHRFFLQKSPLLVKPRPQNRGGTPPLQKVPILTPKSISISVRTLKISARSQKTPNCP